MSNGSKGTVWQYTAIDVASAYTWAELHTTPRNPAAKWTSHLARRVAADLAARGWELETVMTDNGSEFRSHVFGETVAALGARQRFIHAGAPVPATFPRRAMRSTWPASSPVATRSVAASTSAAATSPPPSAVRR